MLIYGLFFGMRHWCATARCIEWKKDNTVLYRVKDWMGHKKTDQTLKYIQLASIYNNNSGSWLGRALKRRRCKTVGGKHGQKIGEKRITQKNRSFVKISPRELADAAGFEPAMSGLEGQHPIQARSRAQDSTK